MWRSRYLSTFLIQINTITASLTCTVRSFCHSFFCGRFEVMMFPFMCSTHTHIMTERCRGNGKMEAILIAVVQNEKWLSSERAQMHRIRVILKFSRFSHNSNVDETPTSATTHHFPRISHSHSQVNWKLLLILLSERNQWPKRYEFTHTFACLSGNSTKSVFIH